MISKKLVDDMWKKLKIQAVQVSKSMSFRNVLLLLFVSSATSQKVQVHLSESKSPPRFGITQLDLVVE